jgi:hypothetical protein
MEFCLCNASCVFILHHECCCFIALNVWRRRDHHASGVSATPVTIMFFPTIWAKVWTSAFDKTPFRFVPSSAVVALNRCTCIRCVIGFSTVSACISWLAIIHYIFSTHFSCVCCLRTSVACASSCACVSLMINRITSCAVWHICALIMVVCCPFFRVTVPDRTMIHKAILAPEDPCTEFPTSMADVWCTNDT